MFTAHDIAELTDEEAVASYRAGFDADERRRIEQQLRSGALRGVVSTSALEMGIDFPTLAVGFNLGVPPTRKAYRQRLGRVGRNGPGCVRGHRPVRRIPSLRGRPFASTTTCRWSPPTCISTIASCSFAHGRCLADEREAMAAPADLPAHIGWPTGFGDRYRAARPGGDRAPEYDRIAERGGDTPHLGYPLRNVGEVSFEIKRSENADRIGEINQTQALRECYPGATYLSLHAALRGDLLEHAHVLAVRPGQARTAVSLDEATPHDVRPLCDHRQRAHRRAPLAEQRRLSGGVPDAHHRAGRRIHRQSNRSVPSLPGASGDEPEHEGAVPELPDHGRCAARGEGVVQA